MLLPHFIIHRMILNDLQSCHLIQHLGLGEAEGKDCGGESLGGVVPPDKVVDDDVRSPEELYQTRHHVYLAPRPVRALVEEHSGRTENGFKG